jgi:hypothetical protein
MYKSPANLNQIAYPKGKNVVVKELQTGKAYIYTEHTATVTAEQGARTGC